MTGLDRSAIAGAAMLLIAPGIGLGETLSARSTPMLKVAVDDRSSEGALPTRPSSVVINDAAITARLKTKLLGDETVGGLSIDVDTFKSEVTLSGDVTSREEMDRALELAKSIDGVSKVRNKLTVSGRKVDTSRDDAAGVDADRSRSLGTAAKDAAITAAVKARLLADSDVSGLDINVDTLSKVVELEGMVESDVQKKRAVDLARRTDGVIEVRDKLTVSN